MTACFDSAKPRGSKIHWSGGCDPAVSMLPLARYARGLATVTLPPLAPPPSTYARIHRERDPSRPITARCETFPLTTALNLARPPNSSPTLPLGFSPCKHRCCCPLLLFASTLVHRTCIQSEYRRCRLAVEKVTG